MKKFLPLFLTLLLTGASSVLALSYPVSTPTGETPGGTYRTYFDNIFQDYGSDCSDAGRVVGGFNSLGVPNCVVPVTSGFFLTGQTIGDTIRFDGTDWVRNNLLYNNGTAIGIANQTPAYLLDVSGTANFIGIRMPTGAQSGAVLTSDASGVSRWSTNPTISASGITGGVQDYLIKWGPSGNGLVLSQFFDNGAEVGLGTITPTAGYKLDIVGGDMLVQGVRIGRGGGVLLANTVLGANPLITNVTSPNNIVIGNSSASTLTAGAGGNILIGNSIETTSATAGNELNIGNWIYGSGGNIGIGVTNTGVAKLEVAGRVKITGGSPAAGRALVSDASGLASWQDVSATSVTATGITGGTEYYIPKFGSGGNGLYASQLYETTGGNVGLGTILPGYKLDVVGTGNFIGFRMPTGAIAGKVLISDATGVGTWGDPQTAATVYATGVIGSTGSGGYINKFMAGGSGITSSLFFESGSRIGLGNTNPSSTLDVSGTGTFQGIRFTNGAGSGLYLISDTTGNARWTSLVMATSLNFTGSVAGSTLRFDGTNWLANTNIFNDGTNVGIGTASPGIYRLNVAGNSYFGGDLMLSGKLYVDSIVNRTVNNVSISGSLLPDVGAPLLYRDIGSNTTRWNNLYLSGQITIGGGSPGVGKILTSDANGLATWTSGFSGTTTATGITGGSGFYIPYFGTGGNGLYPSFMYYTGGKLGINTTNPTYMLDVQGSGSIIRAGSGFCLGMTASGCLNDWTDLNDLVKSTGTPHYIAKFASDGVIGNSTLYETGGQLWVGDITGIIGGSATKGYITIESFGSTNSSNPLLTLSENGGQECRMWINGANKLASNCEWTAGAGGSYNAYQIVRADALGTSLTGSTIYESGSNVSIGASPGTSKFEIWNSSTSSLMHFRGTNNLGIGSGAVRTALTGNANTGIGHESLFTLTSGYSNTSIGYRSMRFTAGGFNNSAFGQETLYNNNGGSWNNAFGYQASYSNTSGTGNIAIGAQSVYYNAIGANNVGIGYQAIRGVNGNSTSNNIAIGQSALYGVTGNNNVSIGAFAGDAITSGTNNITIGYAADVPSATASNQLSIGNWIYGSGGNIGIGVTVPTSTLDVGGTFELGTNGTQLNSIIKATVVKDVASRNTLTCGVETFAVSNAQTTGSVMISPASALADRMIIAYARVSAAGTVEAKFCNESTGTIDVPSMNYYITVIQ